MPTKTNYTPREVRREFRLMIERHKELQAMEATPEYYNGRTGLEKHLATFIYKMDFSVLKTNEVLLLCGLVQSYRPCPLHSFLIQCEELAKKRLTDEV